MCQSWWSLSSIQQLSLFLPLFLFPPSFLVIVLLNENGIFLMWVNSDLELGGICSKAFLLQSSPNNSLFIIRSNKCSHVCSVKLSACFSTTTDVILILCVPRSPQTLHIASSKNGHIFSLIHNKLQVSESPLHLDLSLQHSYDGFTTPVVMHFVSRSSTTGWPPGE